MEIVTKRQIKTTWMTVPTEEQKHEETQISRVIREKCNGAFYCGYCNTFLMVNGSNTNWEANHFIKYSLLESNFSPISNEIILCRYFDLFA